jgi:hypothetical protein
MNISFPVVTVVVALMTQLVFDPQFRSPLPFVFTVSANAQSNSKPSQKEPAFVTPTINLTMEQRHIIKEIVLKDLNIKKAATGIPESIGDLVPPEVDLNPFPSEVYQRVPPVKSYAFFLKDNRVIIVNPKDNKIADVIE